MQEKEPSKALLHAFMESNSGVSRLTFEGLRHSIFGGTDIDVQDAARKFREGILSPDEYSQVIERINDSAEASS